MHCPDLIAQASAASPATDVSSDAPTLAEVRRAVRKPKNGRAAGPDGIPPELLKCAAAPNSAALRDLFLRPCPAVLLGTTTYPSPSPPCQQSGFAGRQSTMDAMLALRILSDLHREVKIPLHVAYVDIKAAFDSVEWKALWRTLKATGVPPFLLHLIQAMHEGIVLPLCMSETTSQPPFPPPQASVRAAFSSHLYSAVRSTGY
ncbi:uncharacterized protein LOC119723619 [Patiria miniata]|uniref:Reverse transcriptase domain-containing protein n=1 Tax=Patiria miniata TaxID=46514 RepID=A0A913ZFX5_PATMI|nr:uncharacterized protein LOC119723619 [Patiria miniata]